MTLSQRLRYVPTRIKVVTIALVSLVGVVISLLVCTAQIRTTIVAERELGVRNAVETAMGVVTYYGDLAANGTMSEKDAQAQALAQLKVLRYHGSEYFWVNDLTPTMLMHATNPKLDGQNVGDMKDPDGVQIFQEFVKVVNASGSGVVNYQWPKPGAEEPAPKISFVTGYKPWGWVVGSGVYVDDIEAAVWSSGGKLALVLLPIGLLTALLSVLVVRSVLGPITSTLVEARRRLADNDVRFRFDVVDPDHEIDQLHLSLNTTLERLERMVDGLTESSTTLELQARALDEASRSMDSAARDTAAKSTSVVEGMDNVRDNVDTLSAGTEEMSASIQEIAHNTQSASQVASSAVGAAAQTQDTVKRLGESSAQINEVVKVITSIAEQTNLLALNATIEAARAGETGKGFAVVAGEVKNLAQESATATEDITSRVEAMQQDVAHAVAAIETISHVIGEINDYQTAIASAVEEQTATTGEMARSVSRTADEGRTAADSATTLSSSAQGTLGQVARVTEVSERMLEVAGQLRSFVAEYQR